MDPEEQVQILAHELQSSVNLLARVVDRIPGAFFIKDDVQDFIDTRWLAALTDAGLPVITEDI